MRSMASDGSEIRSATLRWFDTVAAWLSDRQSAMGGGDGAASRPRAQGPVSSRRWAKTMARSVAVFGFGGLVPSAAQAAAPEATPGSERFILTWSAPSTCPDRSQIEAELRAMLVESMGSETSLRADGRIERSDDGWTLDLHLTSVSGTLKRHLEDDDCAVLANVAVLYIALAVDPSAALT